MVKDTLPATVYFGLIGYEKSLGRTHKLHAICQQHPSASLHPVFLEQLTPLVFAMLLLNLERLQDLTILLCNFRVIRRPVIHVAKDGQRLFASAMLVEISRRLGQSKDENYDSLAPRQLNDTVAHYPSLTIANTIWHAIGSLHAILPSTKLIP